jgi:hypothetical protein
MNLYQRQIIKNCFLIATLQAMLQPALAEKLSIASTSISDEVGEEWALSYVNHVARLKSTILPPKQFQQGTIELRTDSHGVGRLYSVNVPPRSIKDLENVSTRLGFYDESGTWNKLTLSSIKRLFGSLREHALSSKKFYTFDASGNWASEQNIYHVDFTVDGNEVVNYYRVRGIGITSPQWIMKSEEFSEK